MKALLLNSGVGKRMGMLTRQRPKCMTEISNDITLLSRQLKLLQKCGITEVVITTGFSEEVLISYCKSLNLPLRYTFVNNSIYDKTNYIYSIYLAREFLDEDILLIHGDLIFELSVLQDVLSCKNSCMTISTSAPLPSKDFKAVIKDGLIKKVGVNFFTNAFTAQPFYRLKYPDWKTWLDAIIAFCEEGQVNCYAEDAFNSVANQCSIYPMDYKNRLCSEIDTPEDLLKIKGRLSINIEGIDA